MRIQVKAEMRREAQRKVMGRVMGGRCLGSGLKGGGEGGRGGGLNSGSDEEVVGDGCSYMQLLQQTADIELSIAFKRRAARLQR